jgi:type I restriction enzyme S subunit
MADMHPIEAFTVPSDAVLMAGCRMEGSFYGSDGYRAARAMFRSGFKLVDLGGRAKVQWFGPFPRIYVDDPERGIPFLSSSDMMEARLGVDKYVSVALSKNLQSLIVHKGTILISRSGTVGNVALCTENIEGMAVTEHAIRVIPNNPSELGLLYSFLQCQAGQFLIKRSRSGSVVESIYEADVSSLIIPLLPRLLVHRLTELIGEVSRLRVEANVLLSDADAQVKSQCGLPYLGTLEADHKAESLSHARLFTVPSEDVYGPENPFGTVRLDATYYNPLATKLRQVILTSGGRELRAVVLEVRNSRLRKRQYVDDPLVGVPMIGGKQLMQVRPSDVSYLSRALTRNVEEETVQTGWTLVSCGGTLGRTLFVHRNFERWAVSQHVMRLIPNQAEIWPGYLYAFLASPYGQLQVSQRAYGSVIPEIRDFQFYSIAIALPGDRGEDIHDHVVQAFNCRADALSLEDEAIRLFEAAIEEGKQVTEEKWGQEY